MIKGYVEFFGTRTKKEYDRKNKNWKDTNEKEVALCLSNIEIINKEDFLKKVDEFYDGFKCPQWIEDFRNNSVLPDKVYFTTKVDYAPTGIYDKDKTYHDISEFDMYHSTILMNYRGSYIGSMMILKNGEKYENNTFADFDVSSLPF